MSLDYTFLQSFTSIFALLLLKDFIFHLNQSLLIIYMLLGLYVGTSEHG